MADGSGAITYEQVLSTTVSGATNKISAQLGDVRGEVHSDNADWVQHPGIVSRPPKAVPGKAAAYAVVVKTGAQDIVIGSVDHRGLELYANIKEGETGLYAAGEDGNGQARVLLKADGGIHIFTKEGNTDGGKGITLSIRSDGSADLITSKGVALQLGTDASAKLYTPDASVVLEAGGKVKIAATAKLTLSGKSVAIGGGPSASGVATANELALLGDMLVAALNLITPGATTTGGAPAAAAVETAFAAIATALKLKRTTAD